MKLWTAEIVNPPLKNKWNIGICKSATEKHVKYWNCKSATDKHGFKPRSSKKNSLHLHKSWNFNSATEKPRSSENFSVHVLKSRISSYILSSRPYIHIVTFDVLITVNHKNCKSATEKQWLTPRSSKNFSLHLHISWFSYYILSRTYNYTLCRTYSYILSGTYLNCKSATEEYGLKHRFSIIFLCIY